MWRTLKNVLYSLWTYADLSPDIRLRQQVQRTLRQRPCLNAQGWYHLHWQSCGIAQPISDFVYGHLQQYSGLEVGRVYPSDRLNEDLYLPLICWFDWEISFCESFLETFGVNLESEFNSNNFVTIHDLMLFLNQQLLSVSPS